VAFIRQHMLGMAGDAILGYGTKRKSAGGGTKQKAARHRAVRFRRMMGDPFMGMVGGLGGAAASTMAKSLPKAAPGMFDFLKGMAPKFGQVIGGLTGGKPIDYAAIGKAAGQLSQGALASLQRKGAAPTGFGPMPGMPAGLGFLPGFEGAGSSTNKDGSPRRIRADGKPYKRPSLNALNPKALARAGRRFSGFKKAIKSVNASLPSGMKFEAPGARTSTKRRKR